MLKRIIFSTVAIAMICGVPIGFAHADENGAAVKQAIAAGDSWLKLVDEGNYKESWEQFASVVNQTHGQRGEMGGGGKWGADSFGSGDFQKVQISQVFEQPARRARWTICGHSIRQLICE